MKDKLNLKSAFMVLPVALAVIALFMIFAPAAVVKNSDTAYSGLKIAFGYSQSSTIGTTTVSTKWFNASANILTYVLLIAGVVFAILAARGKFAFSRFAAVACLLSAGVLFFCTVAICSPAVSDSIPENMREEYVRQTKSALSLGGGAIAGGVLSLLAAICAAVPAFVKKLSA